MMWGPFGTCDDANAAAWDASANGVKVRTHLDECDPEFETFKDLLSAGEDGATLWLEARVSK
jgi:hypothetical protein